MTRDHLVRGAAAAVIIGCVVLLSLTVVTLARPELRARLGFSPVQVASYVRGQNIGLPAGVYSSSPYTLVLFVRSDCPACRKSAPFFRSLVVDSARGGPVVRLVLDDRDRTDAIAYAAMLGVESASIVHVDLAATPVKRVPTLVLVDRSGTVQSDWEAPMAQEEILRAMAFVHSPR